MNISGVTEADMRVLAQLANMLNIGEWTVNGKDACAIGDTIRWFQKFAAQVGATYSSEKTAPAPEPSVPKEPLPADVGGGLPPGVSVKAFSPGKVGKK